MKIRNEFSDLWAEVDDKTQWVILYVNDELVCALGKYPNARFEILEELLNKVKEKK
jgi:hypothetical protein